MTELRQLDVNYTALSAYLCEARYQYKLAKRDLADASRTGVQSWKAAAFRKLNYARAELRRATRLAKNCLY